MFTIHATRTNSRGDLLVAKSPENGGKQIISYDKKDTASADPHIICLSDQQPLPVPASERKWAVPNIPWPETALQK